MTKFTNHDDYMATLPADRQARIHAKAQAMIKEIEQDNPTDDMLLIDFMAQLPPLESFKNIDAVELQREWRSEWDRTGE